jgi:hypothetical protein
VKKLNVLLIAACLVSATVIVFAGGPANKATGDVQGLVSQSWLHSFDFAAHDLSETDAGKGFIRHFRLENDGVTIIREEFCPVVYAIVSGNEAWFSGPIIYDSNDPSPTRWMVFYALDNGQPGRGNDLLLWERVDDESDAIEHLLVTNPTAYKDFEITSGNLKVHTR